MTSRGYPVELRQHVVDLVEPGGPVVTAWASTVLVQIAQDCFEVLRVGEEADHIYAIAAFEVEPAARKALQPTGPQAVDAAHLSDPR